MEKIKEIYSNNEKKLTKLTKEIFNVVEGKGKVPSNLVVVLESPDENVDRAGLRVSESLDLNIKKALERAGLDGGDAYFTYAVKICPYDISRRGKIKYRQVNDKDVELFSGFLIEELGYVANGIIVTIGENAKKTVLFGENEKFKSGLNNEPELISFENEEDFIKDIDLIVDKLIEIKKGESRSVISSFKQVESDEMDEEISLDAYDVEAWNEFNRVINSRVSNKDIILLYGGSNLKNDACKPIIESMASVFNELNMNVIMLSLFDSDFTADLFLDSLETAAGVVIGSSVDWYGIGYKLQAFLDDVYYSGRSYLLRGMPTMVLTISRSAYEEEGMNFVKNSIEILGATVSDTLTGAIENSVYYDTNKTYQKVVEDKAEDFYRHIKKGASSLPSSIGAKKVYIKVSREQNKYEPKSKRDVTVKEKANTYNDFLETQKRDIDELSEIFMEKMSISSKGKTYKDIFLNSFLEESQLEKSIICFDIEDNKSENFNMLIDKSLIKMLPFNNIDCDVIISLGQKNMENIISKKVTMQKAFLTGEIKVKGNFALLYKMDDIFEF